MQCDQSLRVTRGVSNLREKQNLRVKKETASLENVKAFFSRKRVINNRFWSRKLPQRVASAKECFYTLV